MVKKIYKTFRLKNLCIPFTIDGIDVRINFKGGCSIGSTATYTTSDEKIQKALESLVSFGRDYYIDRIISLSEPMPVKKADEPKQIEEEEEREVVDILDARTFKNLVELRNALKDKGIDVSQVTNVKVAESIAKKNGYNYTIEKNA